MSLYKYSIEWYWLGWANPFTNSLTFKFITNIYLDYGICATTNNYTLDNEEYYNVSLKCPGNSHMVDLVSYSLRDTNSCILLDSSFENLQANYTDCEVHYQDVKDTLTE